MSRAEPQETRHRSIACPECDLLLSEPQLQPGQRARCPRCGFVLSVQRRDPFARAVAYGVSALVLLGVSMAFPFLKMTSGGVENAMNLLQTVSYLEAYGADTIATLIFAFVIVVPAVVLVIAVIVAGLLEMRFFPGWMVAPTRWLFHLNPWSMVEVFSLSVIVSLVKLSSMASVDLGIAFWAYLLFTAMFLMALSSLDRLSLWLRIEAIRGRA